VGTEMYDLSLECEEQKPWLEQYSAWGQRVDRLVTGPAWKRMHDISAEEGLIAISYERKYGEWRLVGCNIDKNSDFKIIHYFHQT